MPLVAKNVNNLVLISDEQDRVIWVNKAFEAQTGYLQFYQSQNRRKGLSHIMKIFDSVIFKPSGALL